MMTGNTINTEPQHYDEGDNPIAARLAAITEQVRNRYENDPEPMFAYPKRTESGGNVFVTMSLDSAIAICGDDIATEDEEQLWKKLDAWYGYENQLQNNPVKYQKSLARGVLALERIQARRAGGGATE